MLTTSQHDNLLQTGKTASASSDYEMLEFICETLSDYLEELPHLAGPLMGFLRKLYESPKSTAVVCNCLVAILKADPTPQQVENIRLLHRDIALSGRLSSQWSITSLCAQIVPGRKTVNQQVVADLLKLSSMLPRQAAHRPILAVIELTRPGGSFESRTLEQRGIELFQSAMEKVSAEQKVDICRDAAATNRSPDFRGVLENLLSPVASSDPAAPPV